jgi:hypothetical protein
MVHSVKEDKRMYIPEFWCGVGAALLTEIVGIVIYAIYDTHKKKGGKK